MWDDGTVNSSAIIQGKKNTAYSLWFWSVNVTVYIYFLEHIFNFVWNYYDLWRIDRVILSRSTDSKNLLVHQRLSCFIIILKQATYISIYSFSLTYRSICPLYTPGCVMCNWTTLKTIFVGIPLLRWLFAVLLYSFFCWKIAFFVLVKKSFRQILWNNSIKCEYYYLKICFNSISHEYLLRHPSVFLLNRFSSQ